ncbi:hypothetical protein [Bradyrhizobium canariense]|uniref:hypothetical protein n=1 Tax=Bradyrhizobium canariense TaxID=255045 RepID=UPI001431CC51|nr:hypothetical protein [Bradyrhizobium canariense]
MVLLTSVVTGEVAPPDAAAFGISNMLRNFQKYALVMGEYLAAQKPQSHLADTGGRWRNISSEFSQHWRATNERSSAVHPEAGPRPSSPYSGGPRDIRAHIPDGGTRLR